MYIGIDCGTQGTKAIVWDEGRVIGQGFTPHKTQAAQIGQREQSPHSWFDALCTSVNLAFKGQERLKDAVKGIGVSGQQHGVVVIDHQQQVIRDAMLWCDTRPHQALKEFAESRASHFVDDIGIQVPVAFTIAKLLWIKRYEPETFAKIHRIMLPHEFLNWSLTGRYAVEPGDASGTGWFDTRSKSLSEKLLAELGIAHTFERPDVLASEEVVGTLTPQTAKRLGLKQQVIVSSGGGDNMMAAIGTGNVDQGQLTISLGTSGTLFSHCHQQVDSYHHPDLNAFCSSSNGYLPLASTMNVTTANNQILSLTNSSLHEFDTMLSSSPIGANGLSTLPFFDGARLPNVPNATGAVLGITSNNLSPANLLRATVEGVTFNLQRGAKTLKDAGVNFNRACIIGGGANSSVWRQLISDVLNIPLWTPNSTEAAATGAAIQAMWAYENQFSPSKLTTLCHEYIGSNQSNSVTPIPTNAEQYASITTNYHQTVDNHMTQFR
ncbi:xylulokinase [Vibrio sp. WXL103]|uniref:xylulokinase n=1 Tax=Vibrio sp. WXL103 TaxID=3450710 RepID=UPI003EC7763D